MGLEITLVGDVTIRRTTATAADGTGADQPRRLRSAQARVAFALLTLERQRGVTRDALAEAVWPEGLPATWESALRTVVSRVRAFVAPDAPSDDDGGPLVAHGGRYLLHLPDDVVVDVEQADSSLTEAQEAVAAGDVARARRLAHAAVARLRPPFLPDHDGEWVTNQREHVGARLVTGLELLSQTASQLGDHAAALVAANDAVARAPLRESAHRCRMAAHAAAGNRAEALRAYQQLRTMLVDEMGVDPSPETETAYLSLLGPLPVAQRPRASTVDSAPAAPAMPPGSPAPFVGRESELAELREAWRGARAGRPRLVLVTGEAGVGKTRLAGEAAREIGTDGALVLLGRCDPSHGTPYQPLVELLDGFLYALPRDWTQEWRPMVRAALATVFPSVAGPDDVPPEAVHDRAQLFDAVTEILVDAAGDRPILIVLDDAPSADEDSLALLRHLVRHVGEAPLLVLALAQPRVPYGHPFADTVRALDRDGLLQRLPLVGLTENDVRDLLEQIRPGDAVEARARLARSLLADTSGNPLMLEALLRDIDDGPDHVVPPGIQALVERKLDGLGDAAHDLLRAAAVAAVGGGQEFDLDLVEHALDLRHLAVLDALDEALDSGLVAEVGSGYRFTQEVTRRTLYSRLSEPRRRHLHEQLADAIEALRPGEREGLTATLAQHRSAAAGSGGDRRAVASARAAADQARADRAPAEVVRLCEEALAHVPDDDVVLQTEVLTDLGLALAEAGEARAEQALLDAALKARRCARPDLAARAALGLADMARAQPALRPDAAALVDDLLGSVEPAPAPSTPGEPAPERGSLLPRSGAGSPGEAGSSDVVMARLVARHVELSPEDDKQRRLATWAAAALVARLDELAGPADARERLALANELVTLGTLVRDDRTAAVAAHHRAMAAALSGDWKTADHALDTAGDQAMRAQRAVVVAVTQGDFAGALALAEKGAPVAPARRQLLVARWLQGRLGAGNGDDDTGNDPAEQVLVALDRGNRGQARLAMHDLASGVDPLPGGDTHLHSLGLLALAAVELGDAATADAVRRQLAPFAELWCADGYRSFVGTVGFHLGRLAAVGGDLADAERYLMPALSQHAEMQARPWVALTQHALADVLAARGRASDRDWVNALRSEVRWMAADLGLRPL